MRKQDGKEEKEWDESDALVALEEEKKAKIPKEEAELDAGDDADDEPDPLEAQDNVNMAEADTTEQRRADRMGEGGGFYAEAEKEELELEDVVRSTTFCPSRGEE